MSSDQAAVVRRFVDAFNRRDFDALVADLGPEVELHEWPEAPGAQSYRGPDGLRRAIDKREIRLFTDREAALAAFGA